MMKKELNQLSLAHGIGINCANVWAQAVGSPWTAEDFIGAVSPVRDEAALVARWHGNREALALAVLQLDQILVRTDYDRLVVQDYWGATGGLSIIARRHQNGVVEFFC
jgi:hypothetical protein